MLCFAWTCDACLAKKRGVCVSVFFGDWLNGKLLACF